MPQRLLDMSTAINDFFMQTINMLFEQFNLELLSWLSTYKQVAKSYLASLKILEKHTMSVLSLSLSKDGNSLVYSNEVYLVKWDRLSKNNSLSLLL